MALAGLRHMYLPAQQCFAFRLRRNEVGTRLLEGTSHRYSAIVLLGLSREDPGAVVNVLHGEGGASVCASLVGSAGHLMNLGDVALSLWAAHGWNVAERQALRTRIQSLGPIVGAHPMVELAWTLDALTCDGSDAESARSLARRIMSSFRPDSGLFPHWPSDAVPRSLRAHVACFADQVYSTHALAEYGRVFDDSGARAIARRCADRMCALQGPEGQWWWHFDIRNGSVIEGYPVYAVHQDAMGPMALLSVERACGADYGEALDRSLSWLADPLEIAGSLVDTQAGVIWRKVGRNEPFKFTRRLQAGASRIHTGLRVPGLNRLLRPTRVDWESRPYHLGWILHAWPPDAVSGADAKREGTRYASQDWAVADASSV